MASTSVLFLLCFPFAVCPADAAATVGAVRPPLDLETAAKREPEAVPPWPLLWTGLSGCGLLLVLGLVNVVVACLCRKTRSRRHPEPGQNEEGVAAASATHRKPREHGNPLYEYLSSINKPRGSDLPQGHSKQQTKRQPTANYEEIHL